MTSLLQFEPQTKLVERSILTIEICCSNPVIVIFCGNQRLNMLTRFVDKSKLEKDI